MTISLIQVAQIILALGLFNVWLIRFNRQTLYRGSSARNMKEEFASYGLPPWSVYVIGFLKVACGVCFIAGLWFNPIVKPAAAVLALLMVGALLMHIKVKDPVKKSLPALVMLALSASVLFIG